MALKSMTLAQSRFLIDKLKFVEPEHLLRNDPVKFLDHLVRAFRLNIPFNTVHLARRLKRGNPFLDYSMDELEAGMNDSTGGSCGFNNGYMNEFLRSLGFQSHLIKAFPLSGPQMNDGIHVAILVRGIRRPNDLFYFDVGSIVPIMRLIEINTASTAAASDLVEDVHARYQFVSNNSITGFLERLNGSAEEQLSPLILRDVRALQNDVNKTPWLVNFLSNEPVMTTGIPTLSAVANGHWFPLHRFASLSPLTDEERTKDALNVAFADLARRACFIGGFSQRNGHYFVFKRRKRVRCHVQRDQDEHGHVKIVISGAPEIQKASSEEEQIEALNAEFPQLTEAFRDNLEFLAALDKKEKPSVSGNLHGVG